VELSELQGLEDAELEGLARRWRAEALRGDRAARGLAHLYEAELRRRKGPAAAAASNLALDLRPLGERGRPPPWWQIRS
jgi:hypothetical protein